jgi:hypothetical protein
MFVSVNAWAIDTFEATTSLLKIDAVVINGVQYNNVVLKLKDVDLVSVGSSAPYGAVSDTCSASNITTANFNAITVGMTLDQVNQTIGCKYDPGASVNSQSYIVRYWRETALGSLACIIVWFDPAGNIVTSYFGDFKSAIGLH